MFRFRDFYHLPIMDSLVGQIVADSGGMTLLAGVDQRLQALHAAGGFLPSGRSTFFQTLLHEIMSADEKLACLALVNDRESVRVPRALKSRVSVHVFNGEESPAETIRQAARSPGLIVLDALADAGAAAAALYAAQQPGVRVLAQMDTMLRGAAAARHLLDLGVPREQLAGLRWVVAVQRLAALCSTCRQSAPADEAIWASLPETHRGALKPPPFFYRAGGCDSCHGTGRQGDVAVFDVYHSDGEVEKLFERPAVLPMEAYLLELVAGGRLPFEEYLNFYDEQLRRAYYMFTASEQQLQKANQAFRNKLVQLEAANRVLTQRTDALISLHDLSQALVGSTGLKDLAARICKHTRDLCGAERVVLYYQHTPDEAEVLGVAGWDPDLVHLQVPAEEVFAGVTSAEPLPIRFRPPPGLDLKRPQIEALRAGLSVPLMAQDQRVGLMLVHSTTKTKFQPGEVSLLQTLASQAAMALQRAGLIEDLRQKIVALEEAQAELVKKERLEQEMALARQVQQSVLPKTFPRIPGYQFAAANEPARQVGGDFYDVIDLGEGFFGVAIADVSDKGMPAALYMALTRSLLRAEARRDRSPAAVVEQVNRLLLELAEPDMFVTLFYAVVDAAARQATYTRAGHDRPVLLRAGQASELGGQGSALGLVDDLRLTEEQVQLQPGDRLVLFTDGLVDVISPEGDLAERSHLIELLRRFAGMPAAELCTAVFSSLESYRGPAEQYDDMTLLVVGVE